MCWLWYVGAGLDKGRVPYLIIYLAPPLPVAPAEEEEAAGGSGGLGSAALWPRQQESDLAPLPLQRPAATGEEAEEEGEGGGGWRSSGGGGRCS